MSHGANAILNLMDELGDNASELLMNELIHYLSSDELIKFVHHFRSMHDMIDDDPEEEDEPDDTTEDMPDEIRTVLYPGHSPGYTDKPSYDPIDW